MALPANITGRLFAVVAASIGLYALLAIATGWDEFRQQIAAFPLRFAPPLLLLSGLNYLLRFWRWELYLRAVDLQLSRRESLIIFFATFVMVITPGKLGEAFKAGILREQHSLPLARGLPVILAERILDFLAVFLLALGGFFWWRGTLVSLELVLVLCGVVIALLLLLRSVRLWQFLLRRTARAPLLARYNLGIAESIRTFRRLLEGRTLALTLLLSLAAWTAECISLWTVCTASNTPINLVDSFFVYSSATLAGSLTFLPGGLGGTELTLIGLLRLSDVPAEASVSIAFIVRLATLWLAVLIGLVFFLGGREMFLGRRPVPNCGDETDSGH